MNKALRSSSDAPICGARSGVWCGWWAILASVSLSAVSALEPTILPPAEAIRLAALQPRHSGLIYTGLSFFEGNLYAATNLGLMEIERGEAKKLFQWNRRYTVVVDGAWVDRANHRLWVWLPGALSLASTDGKTWRAMKLPKARDGYISRGDVLRGYQGVSNATTFWIEGGGHAFAWEPKRSQWIEETNPPPDGRLPAPQCAALIPFEDGSVFVMRHESDDKISSHPLKAVRGRPPLQSDTLHYRFGPSQWRKIPGAAAENFFVKEAVLVGDRAYVRTQRGEIWEITRERAVRFDAPGVCLALAAGAGGSLFAYFHDQGVYERTSEWRLRLPAPVLSGDGNHWMHLAEYDGQLALAASPVPEFFTDGPTKARVAGLWLSDGGGWKPVSFSGERGK